MNETLLSSMRDELARIFIPMTLVCKKTTVWQKTTGMGRPKRSLMTALLAFGAALAPASNVAAQQQAPRNWLVNCSNSGPDGALQCRMSQSIVTQETGQMILQVALQKAPETPLPAMLLTVPLGLFLPAGVQMSIDEQALTPLQLQTCDAGGCYAGTAVDQGLLDAMRSGAIAEFVVQNLERREIRIQVSLIGFTDAYGKML